MQVCEDDATKAECMICKTLLSCGGTSAKNFPTSALNNHLKFKHPDEYAVVKADRKTSQESAKASGVTTSPTHVQTMLTAVTAKTRKWAIDSAKVRKVHDAVGRMIAVDVQPYSIVEDSGF